MIVVHAAGLRFAFSRLIGINWAYILEDGVADQRMLGPVFQPSTFGVLLVLSIFLFLDRKPLLAGLCAALAAILHPTYLLASGVLTASYMLVTYREHRRLKAPLLIGLSALLPVLPLLAYLWTSFGGEPPQITLQSRQILVDYRIPHHALVCAVARRHRPGQDRPGGALPLSRTPAAHLPGLAAALPGGILLTLLQVITRSYSLALLFPWRISIFLVPLSTSLLIAFLVTRLLSLPAPAIAGLAKGSSPSPVCWRSFSACWWAACAFSWTSSAKPRTQSARCESYIYAHKSAQRYLPDTRSRCRISACSPAPRFMSISNRSHIKIAMSSNGTAASSWQTASTRRRIAISCKTCPARASPTPYSPARTCR